jgi:hypothetical protein
MYDFSALYICVRNRPIDEFWHGARLESATIASPGRTAAGGLCLNGWFSKTCQKRYEVARGLVAGRTSRQRVATASVATIVSLGSRIDVYEGIVFEVSAVCCRCRQDPGNIPGNFFILDALHVDAISLRSRFNSSACRSRGMTYARSWAIENCCCNSSDPPVGLSLYV